MNQDGDRYDGPRDPADVDPSRELVVTPTVQVVQVIARPPALRARLAELAQRPAVVAAASAGAGLAVGLVTRALANATSGDRRTPTPLVLTGYLMQEVHVFHHVVHHVRSLPPQP